MNVFLKNKMGISMKNTQSADFCADKIDVITNFAVIMNVVIKIKSVHCTHEFAGFRIPGMPCHGKMPLMQRQTVNTQSVNPCLAPFCVCRGL